MSRCKCDEVGDYAGCPRHGDNSDWLKEQYRQDALRADRKSKAGGDKAP